MTAVRSREHGGADGVHRFHGERVVRQHRADPRSRTIVALDGGARPRCSAVPDATRTMYPVISEPPLFTGAVHDTCIEVRYPVATTARRRVRHGRRGGGTRVDGRYFCVVADIGERRWAPDHVRQRHLEHVRDQQVLTRDPVDAEFAVHGHDGHIGRRRRAGVVGRHVPLVELRRLIGPPTSFATTRRPAPPNTNVAPRPLMLCVDGASMA